MSISSTTTVTATATFLLLLTLTIANRPPRSINKIYAFGASYVDTGNTNATTAPSIFRYASNPPYGRTFFNRPTNRYSDGRLIIDFVAESLSLPYLPPYLNPTANTCAGINYAVAGSTAIEHEFFVENNLPLAITPQSLQTQLSWNGPRLGFQELYKVCCGAGGGPYNFNLAAICGSQSASSCQDPSTYVNWDGLHLTEAMHKVLFDMFLDGPFTYPPLKYLLRC
ncbi:hypothetical protein M8C21_020434 [Ambrosia artemisiifolia]|uniref:GDSL esterase/lipase n=1 Tax=Ambrosia artemisiifolia TaxID=4212 RepID=A0AAD5BSN0_AMBAR|nr:hypothetical protein M8C21_020434 [Ambrosia artemisiifolia]